MKKIYGIITYGSTNGVQAYAIDGDTCKILDSHFCSSEGFAKSDLGFTKQPLMEEHESGGKHSTYHFNERRKEMYDQMYPDGYEAVWVGYLQNNPQIEELWNREGDRAYNIFMFERDNPHTTIVPQLIAGGSMVHYPEDRLNYQNWMYLHGELQEMAGFDKFYVVDVNITEPGRYRGIVKFPNNKDREIELFVWEGTDKNLKGLAILLTNKEDYEFAKEKYESKAPVI